MDNLPQDLYNSLFNFDSSQSYGCNCNRLEGYLGMKCLIHGTSRQLFDRSQSYPEWMI